MRPVPPRSAACVDAAVPRVRSWFSVLGPRSAAPSSVTGLGLVPVSAARTCWRSQRIRERAHGAMTAALVIVPADPVPAWPASAHRGPATGSPVGPREVLSGAPWMVRLSMARGDVLSPVRLAPGQDASLGPAAG